MNSKICNKCGVQKALDTENFRLRRGSSDGFRNDCRECGRKARKGYYDLNPEKAREDARKWAVEHPEHRAATQSEWHKKNKDRIAAYQRRRLYGITEQQYQQMFSRQSGKCAICGFQFLSSSRGNRRVSPHVDHCHVSGKVRGLLCNPCNRMLGYAKDSMEILKLGIDYLLTKS